MVLTHPRPWQDRAILALMLAELVVWSGFFYAFLALPLAIVESTGWRLSAVMGGYSLALVCLALSTPLAGRVVDREMAPRVLPLAAVVGACALAGLPLADNLGLYFALWAVVGVAMGFTLYEPVFSMLTRARGDAARGGITAIAIAAGAASLVSFPSAHWLTQQFGWPVALWTFAVAILALAVPALRYAATRLEAERPAQTPEATSSPTTRDLMGERAVRALILVFILPALASGLILSQIVPLFSALALPTGVAIAAAAAIGPMQIAARLIVQATARRRSARQIVLAACLCLSLAAACLALAGHILAAVAVFVLAFGAGNGLVGIFRPLVIRDALGPANIGAKTGAVAMPALLTVAVAPILGARILETASAGALLAIAGAAPLFAAFALGALPDADAPDPDA